jgi:hypothetical protein
MMRPALEIEGMQRNVNNFGLAAKKPESQTHFAFADAHSNWALPFCLSPRLGNPRPETGREFH